MLPVASAGHPADDEVEVVVIGPGRGECVLVHIGGGDWMIVDSCQPGGKRREHPALAYLDSIGADLGRVRLLVATHWHDDHIRGLDVLAGACPNARIVLSSALHADEIPVLEVFAPVGRQVAQQDKLTSGVEMLQRVCKLAAQQPDDGTPFRLLPAAAGTPLPVPPGKDGSPARMITALSPSPLQQIKATASIRSALAQAMADGTATIPAPDRNETALVVLVRVGDASILLSADLEKETDSRLGWQAVVTEPTRTCRAEVVKAAHHGGDSGHDDKAWPKLVHDEPLILVAPWSGGGEELPTPDDVTRMRTSSGTVLQSSPVPSAVPRRRSDGRRHIPHGISAGRVAVRRRVAPELTPVDATHPAWTVAVHPPGFQHL